MKSSDLEVYHLSKQFERLGTCLPAGPEKALETQIYEALLDLMELVGKITENMDSRSQTDAAVDRDAYLRMAALDREFGNWYARLPEPLKWMPLNINTAPFSFFNLHQQYHAALILLHRPFAMYEEPSGSDSEDSHSPDNHFSALSRTVCTKHAIRVARIFWQHRQRFDTKQICVTGLQHAGTAATALVAALAYIKDANDRNDNMQYLECLSASLQDMSQTYQPAERMFLVLQAVLSELRGTPDDTNNLHRPNSVVIPARRSSTCVDDMEPPAFTKRRQVARAYSKSKLPPVDRRHSIDPTLSNNHKMHHRKQSQSESDRIDGFVMVTPQSEISSWANLSSDNTSTSLAPSHIMQKTSNTWMMGNMDEHGIEHLATVHFPELNDLAAPDGGHTMNGLNGNSVTSGNDGPNGNGTGGNTNTNQHLDFMVLGGDEWKDW